jgi:two-component system OmpR family response regulator
MAKILVVDDDRNCAAFLRLFLTDEGHEVRSAITGKDAVVAAAALWPNLLITDWLLKDGTDGLSLALHLRREQSELQIIFITGMPERELRPKIAALSDAHIFEKPLDLDRLLPLVNHIVGARAV